MDGYGLAGNGGGCGRSDSPAVRSSFAGALARVMRRERLDASEVSLLTQRITEADVGDLLGSRRLPTAEEVVLIADALGVTLDDLLGHQRATHHPRDGEGGGERVCELVSMELRVSPEVRTALRLRKATTGLDIGDILRDLIGSGLHHELELVRGPSGEDRGREPSFP